MIRNMLSLKKATKRYGASRDFRGIHDVTFSVNEGEVICLLGPSGSGKTTLLRCLAGLESLDKGVLSQEAQEGGRISGYVSQEYTLWPHLTVLENLTLAPLLKKKESAEAVRREAKKLLRRFGLEAYTDNYPLTLSGGQRQRVALLRAVLSKPKVLLLDEITSSLDPQLTKGVLDLIRALAKDGYTMVIATHHMSFAMSVADRILFFKNGRLIQDASAVQFFMNQPDKDIRSFIVDIAKRDESVEVFRGFEQFQAYQMGLLKRLPEGSTIYVAGAVGDAWYEPMGEFYAHHEALRIRKKIKWKMVTYDQADNDRRLMRDYPELNEFRKMPRSIQNPANYNVFGDTVITQIFEDEPTIIQIKNQSVADAYMRFFEELWAAAR